MARRNPLLFCLVMAFGAAACDDDDQRGDARNSTGSETVSAGKPTAELRAGVGQGSPVDSSTVEPAGRPKVVLRFAVSDLPGALAWEIAKHHGWFEEAGLEVELDYYEYVPSLEAFSAGKADALVATNRDLLLMANSGVDVVGVLATATSFGDDAIVARSGVADVGALRGKLVAVETGFSSHALILHALSQAGMKESDVEFVNVPASLGPRRLQRGDVHAIATRQPYSTRALLETAGSQTIYTTRQAPGLFYQLLCVRPSSLNEHRAAWRAIPQIWQRVVDYVIRKDSRSEAVSLLAARAGIKKQDMRRWIDSTRFIDLEANRRHFASGETLDSLRYSTQLANTFHVTHGLQGKPENVDTLLDARLLERP